MADKKYALGEVLISRDQIAARVAEMGKEISKDYAGKELLVVGILRGSVPFMADLIREIDNPLTIDFMSVSSYGASTKTSGVVRILKDMEVDIAGKDVLIVEDIVDSGLTLSRLVETLKTRQPASLKVCTFLDKPAGRKVEFEPDYKGFTVDDVFIVGYGLDLNQQYRQLPHITHIVTEE